MSKQHNTKKVLFGELPTMATFWWGGVPLVKRSAPNTATLRGEDERSFTFPDDMRVDVLVEEDKGP